LEIRHGSRSGSGEVQVSDLELLGGDGTPVTVLLTGQRVTLRMHYVAHAALSGIIFALGFNHENGVGIAGATTRIAGMDIAIEPGTGYIDYTFDELPLLPATWRVSTRVSDHGHTYDHLDKAFVMSVRAPSGEAEPGAVRVDGHWSAVTLTGRTPAPVRER
jgi:lipopolysaccharide transport system ATP-binding protein